MKATNHLLTIYTINVAGREHNVHVVHNAFGADLYITNGHSVPRIFVKDITSAEVNILEGDAEGYLRETIDWKNIENRIQMVYNACPLHERKQVDVINSIYSKIASID